MDLILGLVDFILHIDVHLDALTRDYGFWTYLILFLIVFCETGLVATPFLPGDSLLFAAGAIAARGVLDVYVMGGLLIVAAIIGDTVNYHIGYFLGPKVLHSNDAIFFKRKHLERTERFYAKYGGKAIVFARFVPIVRTFAPFLAGVGRMPYGRFIGFNVGGAVLWVLLFVGAGFYFGELPAVKQNFTLVIFGIIGVSVLPLVIEYVRSLRPPQIQESGTK